MEICMKTHPLFFSGMMSVLLLVPLAVSAQYLAFRLPAAGPYVRFDLGPTFPDDGRLIAFGNVPTGNTVRYDTGFASTVAGGYAFNPWIAAELEFGWSWNEISQVQGFRLADTFFGQVSFLANVVLQYPLPLTRLVPYIGGGLGGAATIFETDGFSNRAVTVVGSDSDLVFTYQMFAGLRFDLNPWMSVGVSYKYFVSDDSSYRFESLVCCRPDLHVQFEGMSMHMVTGNFTLKY
jgi:opacity protein-like surface antigen